MNINDPTTLLLPAVYPVRPQDQNDVATIRARIIANRDALYALQMEPPSATSTATQRTTYLKEMEFFQKQIASDWSYRGFK